MNVIELIKAHIPKSLILKASKFLGESENDTEKGFETAIPAILAGILNAINNKEKMVKIWDLIQHMENDPELLNQLDGLFGGNSVNSANTGIGARLLSELFEGKHTILNSINNLSGFQNNSSAGKVLSTSAPMVLAFLRNKVQNSELGMASLLIWLVDEKDSILKTLPSGWTSQMGMTHLMYRNEKNMEMDSEGHSGVHRLWWLWLIGLIGLIFGLWILVKSCNQIEMENKNDGATKNVTTIIDSAAKSAQEKLDSADQVSKSQSAELGEFINIRLGEYFISLPEKGIELKLVQWLQDNGSNLDKAPWFNFDRILFDRSNSNLTKVSEEQIKNIATIMKVMQHVHFKICGYPDNYGDPASNLKLSLARAEAVKQALVEEGLDAKRMETEGFGSDQASADNIIKAGKDPNRRVMIKVTKK